MPPTPPHPRRRFLSKAAAVGLAGLLAGCQQTPGTDGSTTTPHAYGTTTDEPTPGTTREQTTATDEQTTTTLRGRGRTHLVLVGPDGDTQFSPASLTIDPGASVRFVWKSDGHSVDPQRQPADASWEGHRALEDAGFEYEHTFRVPGVYEYACTPHEALGATGAIHVQDVGPEPVTSGPVQTDRIEIGAGDDLDFDPGTDRPAEVGVGEELTFVWRSPGHNLVPTNQPDAADWTGHEAVEDAGFEVSFTFDVPGRYDFVCEPHRTLGARGTLFVEE